MRHPYSRSYDHDISICACAPSRCRVFSIFSLLFSASFHPPGIILLEVSDKVRVRCPMEILAV